MRKVAFSKEFHHAVFPEAVAQTEYDEENSCAKNNYGRQQDVDAYFCDITKCENEQKQEQTDSQISDVLAFKPFEHDWLTDAFIDLINACHD
jgi:hypothetical protein